MAVGLTISASNLVLVATTQPLPDPGVMILAVDGVLCVTSERKYLYAIESAKPGTGQAP